MSLNADHGHTWKELKTDKGGMAFLEKGTAYISKGIEMGNQGKCWSGEIWKGRVEAKLQRFPNTMLMNRVAFYYNRNY